MVFAGVEFLVCGLRRMVSVGFAAPATNTSLQAPACIMFLFAEASTPVKASVEASVEAPMEAPVYFREKANNVHDPVPGISCFEQYVELGASS